MVGFALPICDRSASSTKSIIWDKCARLDPYRALSTSSRTVRFTSPPAASETTMATVMRSPEPVMGSKNTGAQLARYEGAVWTSSLMLIAAS